MIRKFAFGAAAAVAMAAPACLADECFAAAWRSLRLGEPCARFTRHLLEVQQADDLPVRRPPLPRLAQKTNRAHGGRP